MKAKAPLGIHDLVSYRLQKATYYATKHAYLVYVRRFGITSVEWRLIGNLSMDGPLSLVTLSEEADIQLAQASRTITQLIARGIVRSAPDKADGRRVLLSLAPAGRALYRKVFAEASARHERLLSVLSRSEEQLLFEMLEKIAAEGRAMLEEERAGAAVEPT